MVIKVCLNCNEEKDHHAKGLCYPCYKKTTWKPKIQKCHRCLNPRAIHAKNLCASCYNYTFHKDSAKAYHARRKNNLTLTQFRKTTKECVLCGFSHIVDIHYIDSVKSNNSPKNLIGLCPNHKRMINNHKFKEEILQELKQKGFNIPTKNIPTFQN